MIRCPHAKLNLGLRILRRRPDGYHDIESLFYPIPLYDLLELLPSSEPGLTFDDGGFGEVSLEDNLVSRAYRAFVAHTGIAPDVHVSLRKVIPSGAGLGGGSSDAATLLRMLRDRYAPGMDNQALMPIARSLGADCPYFLTHGPQIARGIGDDFVHYPKELRGYYLTLLFSDIHISTRDAYQAITPRMPAEPIEATLQRPMVEWRDHLLNDFEEVVFGMYPQLSEHKSRLYEAGAVYASMTGTGSTLYAFSSEPLEIEVDAKVTSILL